MCMGNSYSSGDKFLSIVTSLSVMCQLDPILVLSNESATLPVECSYFMCDVRDFVQVM